jgi:DNA-binding NarL/FixJ family response regulator
MPEPVSILIADDHTIILDGIESLLSGTPFHVVGRCTRGDEVLAAMERLDPSIVILDNRMPGLTGLELIRILSENDSPVPLILLTGSIADRESLEAVRLGVHGLVLKENATKDLIAAITAVADGERWIDPDAMERAKISNEPALSRRELQIVDMVCRGLRNEEIAREAGISVNTVKRHLYSIYGKLGVESRTELMRRFTRDR